MTGGRSGKLEVIVTVLQFFVLLFSILTIPYQSILLMSLLMFLTIEGVLLSIFTWRTVWSYFYKKSILYLRFGRGI